MHDHRVGSVVIVHNGIPVGILTERDVLRLAAGTQDNDQKEAPTTVATSMTTPAECIAVSTDLTVALTTMRERGYRHMPVVDGERLVGVVGLYKSWPDWF